MKILKTVIATVIVLGSFTAVFADESVDTQIANIKGASAQERVQLMNEFKLKLAAMNAQEREDAINQLRSQVQTQTRTQAGAQDGVSIAKMEKTELKVQAMSQTDQMNQVQNMNQIQMMSQQQLGNMVGDLAMDPASMPMSPGVLPGAAGGTISSVPSTNTVTQTTVTSTVPTH